jgi:hypothetical protein
MKKIDTIKFTEQEFSETFDGTCIINNYELLSADTELLLLLGMYSADGN